MRLKKLFDPPIIMPNMHSPNAHCCCCVTGVFASLLGIILISTGVCIVLNYGIEVDTNALPKEWQNENGKKIVGIILICCGFVSFVISIVVGSLYFTVCTKTKTQPTVNPQSQANRTPRPSTRSRPSDPNRPNISPASTRKHSKSKRKITKSKRPRLETHPELCESSLNLTAESRRQSLAGLDNPAYPGSDVTSTKNNLKNTLTESKWSMDTADTPSSISSSQLINSTESSQNSGRLPPLLPVTLKESNRETNDVDEQTSSKCDLNAIHDRHSSPSASTVNETEMQTLNVPVT